MQVVTIGTIRCFGETRRPFIFYGLALIILSLSAPARAAQATSSTAAQAAPQQPTDTVSTSLNSEVRFSTWEGTRGSDIYSPAHGSGSQIYVPMQLSTEWQRDNAFDLQASVKSGYVWSHHNTPGQEASFAGPVDTQVSFNFTWLNFNSFQPYVGLALNLPTGEPFLAGNTRFTRMDPDLVDVGSYGAGFNINPSAGITFALDATTALSIGVGYTWQGNFMRETQNPDTLMFNMGQKVHPGDVLSANVNILKQWDSLSLTGSFTVMRQSPIELDNVKISQEGLQFVTNLTATYAVNDRWGMEATGSWSFEQKDKLQTPRGGLVTESENTNSNLFIVSAGPRFLINDKLTIGLNYSLLYRDANEYDITNDRFIAAKTKHSAGLTLDYAVTPTETISCRISHFWVDQDGGPLLPITVVNPGTAAEAVTSEYQPPELRYTGWAGGISGTIQF